MRAHVTTTFLPHYVERARAAAPLRARARLYRTANFNFRRSKIAGGRRYTELTREVNCRELPSGRDAASAIIGSCRFNRLVNRSPYSLSSDRSAWKRIDTTDSRSRAHASPNVSLWICINSTEQRRARVERTAFPRRGPSTLFLIFVTNGRNELNSPRRTLCRSAAISVVLSGTGGRSGREREDPSLARTANITYGRLACLGYNRPRV